MSNDWKVIVKRKRVGHCRNIADCEINKRAKILLLGDVSAVLCMYLWWGMEGFLESRRIDRT